MAATTSGLANSVKTKIVGASFTSKQQGKHIVQVQNLKFRVEV
jgi:hypothetical protein